MRFWRVWPFLYADEVRRLTLPSSLADPRPSFGTHTFFLPRFFWAGPSCGCAAAGSIPSISRSAQRHVPVVGYFQIKRAFESSPLPTSIAIRCRSSWKMVLCLSFTQISSFNVRSLPAFDQLQLLVRFHVLPLLNRSAGPPDLNAVPLGGTAQTEVQG